MDRPIWTDQCKNCGGKRYPSAAKLRKHKTRTHGERVHCQFQECNWNCSSQDVYRLRKHKMNRHSNRRYIPMPTPRPHQSMPSLRQCLYPACIPLPTPNWKLNESTRHSLVELDQEMPDFADMFNFREPATPSLMGRLRDEDSPGTLFTKHAESLQTFYAKFTEILRRIHKASVNFTESTEGFRKSYGTTHSSVSVRSAIKKIYIYFHSIFFLFR